MKIPQIEALPGMTPLGIKPNADKPLKPSAPQEACDVGLFSDDSKQIDLVDECRKLAATPDLSLRADNAMTPDEKRIQEAVDYAGHISRAREMYTNDDIEIDDTPAVSVTDDGVWVASWVFVHNEEIDGA